jgi:hypothetical protein
MSRASPGGDQNNPDFSPLESQEVVAQREEVQQVDSEETTGEKPADLPPVVNENEVTNAEEKIEVPSTNTDEKEEEKTEAAANEEELMADNKRKDMSEVVDEDLNMKKQKIEEGEAQIEDSKPAAVEV